MTTNEQLTLDLLEHVSPMLWNVARSTGMEFDDLYQDASLVILRVLDRYQQENHANLTRLAMRCVRNYTLDLIDYRRYRRHASLDELIGTTSLADLLPDPYNIDPLLVLLIKERLQELAPLVARASGSHGRKVREVQATAQASIEREDDAASLPCRLPADDRRTTRRHPPARRGAQRRKPSCA